MLLNLSEKLADSLFKGRQKDDNYEVCVYALELLIYSVLSTAGLLLIGTAFCDLPSCATIIAVFYICQTVGGGRHANSHIACFSVIAVFLCIALLVCRFSIPQPICICSGSLSLVCLFLLPLSLHKNKEYLRKKEKHIAAVSRICTLTIAGVYILVCLRFNDICLPFSIGLTYAALSRYSGSHTR